MIVPVLLYTTPASLALGVSSSAAAHTVWASSAACCLDHVLHLLAWYETDVLCVAPTTGQHTLASALRAQKLKGHMLLADTTGNTAALALAATHLRQLGVDPLMLVCPTRLPLRDPASLAQAVRQAEPAAQAGAIVAMGVLPSLAGPLAQVDRIDPGAARLDGSQAVDRFGPQIPGPVTGAGAGTSLGYWLCNTGLYLARASTLLDALTRYTPATVQAAQEALKSCPQHSEGGHVTLWTHAQALHSAPQPRFEAAVLTRHRPLAVVSLHATWIGNDIQEQSVQHSQWGGTHSTAFSAL